MLARHKTLIIVIQILLVVLGLMWFVFGGMTYIRTRYLIITALMIANGLIILLLVWRLGKREKLAYLATLIYLGINIILTLTDQVGLWDWIALALAGVAFVLLVLAREEFLQKVDG